MVGYPPLGVTYVPMANHKSLVQRHGSSVEWTERIEFATRALIVVPKAAVDKALAERAKWLHRAKEVAESVQEADAHR
jgi:hypothetical protein